ncbi:hypothetical protein [Paenibacillus donghaensis]|uniref:Uncharacterized protein n=1 Tax=Paenibacillus donghaensis TaxID=414771 RepID=A0A2Z2K4S7_9BACL|nr:hypothetical protein [Paenibacillus donghaensis]ASA20956.1 hypothetical protein B9T62_09260 [Paenibacillus donghaensis]
MGYLIFAAVVIGGIFWLMYTASSEQQKKLLEAREVNKNEYYESLAKLSSHSEEPQFRIDALEKGRKYYASLRPDGISTITDETSIANDLNAYSGHKSLTVFPNTED